MSRERYRIADLLLDVDAVSLRRDAEQADVDLALPKLSFDLLVALARKAPAVVSSDQLVALVWEGNAVSDETLTQRVALLRRALGDNARQPRYLRAVRGRGYQLVPEAVLVHSEDRAESLPAPAPAGNEPGSGPSPGRARSHNRLGVAALLGALTLAAIAAGLWMAGRRSNPTARGAAEPAPSASPVATRAASLNEILERAGSYLRQQQSGDNDLAIELYRRALALRPEEPRALAGLSLALAQRATKFNERGTTSAEAIALARRAVEAAPGLAVAHHALGLALDSEGRVGPALAAYRRAAELAGREGSVESPASALASAANLLMIQGHLAEALELNLRAARIRKGREEIPYLEVQIGSTLALLGFDAAALIWFERALELRPDNVFAATSLARRHLSRARLREADAAASSALTRGVRRPSFWEVRGVVALLRGDEPAARRAFGEALAVAPGFPRARIQLLLLDLRTAKTLGDLPAQGHALLAEIREGRRRGDEWPDSWIDEALVEAGLAAAAAAGSEKERRGLASLEALDGAIARGYRDAGWLLLEPGFATLRANSGFPRRTEAIRNRIAAERQRVEGAPWLPPGFLAGAAGRAASR